MKQLTDTMKPRFLEDQQDLTAPLPGFVTRTTLRKILQNYEVETLIDLGTRSEDVKSSKATLSGR